ncbi:hypothetical protein PBAC_28210 [Pedobacter glucosidilyticus]|nr:hypothetical protein [Pedobacter glucosidilyticus]KHJ36976.1 hypothetical protein PBAC_28210 [Pedobacter glucosidilyticus]
MKLLSKLLHHIKFKIWLYYKVIIPQFYFSVRLGNIIRGGPFKGAIYNLSSIGSTLTPKLLGTYEHELYEYFTSDFLKNYERFIDIGAAEGYYVVGVRYLNQEINLIAFETEAKGRKKLLKNLLKNNLWDDKKVLIKSECTHLELKKALMIKQKTFVLCDIEGYENILLDLNKVPQLSSCDILVEIHHNLVKNIEDILLDRFSTTHEATKINKLDKTILSKNYTDYFIHKKFNYLCNEFRKNETWIFFKSKAHENTNF